MTSIAATFYVSSPLTRTPGTGMMTARFVPMSQCLGGQNCQDGQIGQFRATVSHATYLRHLQASSMLPRTRLRCVGFQAAGAPAPGMQKVSKDQSSTSRSTISKDASNTGQQPRPAAGVPKQTVPVEPGVLHKANGNVAAAKQQDADRMQAAEEASTSGREYWQVMLPPLLCYICSLYLKALTRSPCQALCVSWAFMCPGLMHTS